jgi:predicted lipoprotein with Yx(FWY)xxD motif
MKRTVSRIVTLLLSLALGLMLTVSTALAGSVQVTSKAGLGNYLTDDEGMTLYMFKKDTAGKSACTGPCLEKWPLFYVEKVENVTGVANKDFGVITRDDGMMQSTYKGMPLYYFFQDKAAGDTKGQGFNSVWYVVAP